MTITSVGDVMLRQTNLCHQRPDLRGSSEKSGGEMFLQLNLSLPPLPDKIKASDHTKYPNIYKGMSEGTGVGLQVSPAGFVQHGDLPVPLK